MANTENLIPVDLSEQHIDDAMKLVKEAGWNQCPQDWRMMIAAGDGYGFVDDTGKLIATCIILPYGSNIGWISMVLVTNDFQRRGLATLMIDRAIGILKSRAMSPCLDATPAGEQVYLKRGFVPTFSFHRWQRPGVEIERFKPGTLSQSDLKTVQDLDQKGFGKGREPLLADIANRDAPCLLGDDGTSFALSRAGRVGHQIGPIVANTTNAAISLFDAVLASVKAPVFIDVPDIHAGFIQHIKSAGFTKQRAFKRMVHGQHKPQWPEACFAIFGPELG
jgi:GNAT superfamily N-acetyltransferase